MGFTRYATRRAPRTRRDLPKGAGGHARQRNGIGVAGRRRAACGKAQEGLKTTQGDLPTAQDEPKRAPQENL
eukprot:9396166-Pyramimonas_sp.AAC.1